MPSPAPMPYEVVSHPVWMVTVRLASAIFERAMVTEQSRAKHPSTSWIQRRLDDFENLERTTETIEAAPQTTSTGPNRPLVKVTVRAEVR